jgi:hypothetical protein
MSGKPATPLERLDPPHRRQVEMEIETGLPPGTEVFSADGLPRSQARRLRSA